jgi:uncharacterized protein
MARSIKIQIDLETYLEGSHSCPTEGSVAALDRLLIIMVHGFPGDKNVHGNLYHDLEFLLRDKGYHTLRFDFRGCGESDGRQEEFTLSSAREDLNAVCEWAHEQGYERFMLIGEGLGGTVSLMHPQDKIAAVAVFWPMLDLPQIARSVFQAGNMRPEWLKAGYMIMDHDRIGIPFIKELMTLKLDHTLAQFKTPLLVMHGARDQTVPIEQLDMLRAHVQSKRLEITSFHDGEHGLPGLNHRKTLYYHLTQFIEKYT